MKNDLRQQLHLEPQSGWLKDPNGLCFFKGRYHVYFQYAPGSADGSGYLDMNTGVYTEWDCGFDFYAPQSFIAPDGRRILIGWMGIGDIPYTNPTAALGWQHCLTVPCELTLGGDGKLLRDPVAEIDSLVTHRQGQSSRRIYAEKSSCGSLLASPTSRLTAGRSMCMPISATPTR